VYLNDLARTDMVEFGHVLPEPGGEQAWVDELPSDLHKELATRGGGGQPGGVDEVAPASEVKNET
jgi:hypothetical protein